MIPKGSHIRLDDGELVAITKVDIIPGDALNESFFDFKPPYDTGFVRREIPKFIKALMRASVN